MSEDALLPGPHQGVLQRSCCKPKQDAVMVGTSRMRATIMNEMVEMVICQGCTGGVRLLQRFVEGQAG